MSKFDSVGIGIPQGSVLSSILFLIFINDLPFCPSCTVCNIYADGTEIQACGNTVDKVCGLLQTDIYRMFTVSLFYKIKHQLYAAVIKSSDYRPWFKYWNVYHTKIEQTNSIKYLGTHIDANVKWTVHTPEVCKTVSPKIGLL